MELYEEVIRTISGLELKLSVKLKNENKIGLILHLAFMISKLKNGDESIEFHDKIQFMAENTELYNTVKENLIKLCDKYTVNIEDNEICYVMNFLLHQDSAEY